MPAQDGAHEDQAEDIENDAVGRKDDNISKNYATEVPDGGWGWLVVIGSCITFASFGGTFRGFTVLYMAFLDRFGASHAVLSVIPGLVCGLWGGFAPIVTALVQRYSCRVVAIAGSLIMSTGIIATAFAPRIEVVYVTYGLLGGIGLSLTYTTAFLVIGQYFEKRKATALGLGSLGSALGAFAFPPFLQFLHDTYGYMGLFMIVGAVTLHNCVSGCLYRPLRIKNHVNGKVQNQSQGQLVIKGETSPENESNTRSIKTYRSSSDHCVHPSMKRLQNEKGKQTIVSETKSNPHKSVSSYGMCAKQCKFVNLTLLTSKIFIATFWLAFFASFTAVGTSIFLVPLAVSYGFGHMPSAFIVSVGGIADCFGRPILGIVLDMKRMRGVPRKFVLAGLLIMSGATCIAIPFCFSFVALAVIVGLRTACFGTFMAQRLTLITDLFGRDRVPDVLGLTMMGQAVGSVISPIIGGLMKDSTGLYSYFYYMSGGILSFIATLYIIFMAHLDKTNSLETKEDVILETDV